MSSPISRISFGTGFVVDSERRRVLTNGHVVSRSLARVEVAAQRGSYARAGKIYVDPTHPAYQPALNRAFWGRISKAHVMLSARAVSPDQ